MNSLKSEFHEIHFSFSILKCDRKVESKTSVALDKTGILIIFYLVLFYFIYLLFFFIFFFTTPNKNLDKMRWMLLV